MIKITFLRQLTPQIIKINYKSISKQIKWSRKTNNIY